jgi:signal transduction histidine kinase
LLLTVLLIETMFLYSRLASAITLQRHERTNRLLSVEAVTGAIAHELGAPLGAIALNASTALSQLRSTPRELEESGPGISAVDRERIFDPFFTTKPGGMGLGLAISSTLVASRGGKLRLIKSDSDGSIFEIAIPIGGQRSA